MGDLAFASPEHRAKALEELREQGHDEAVEAVQDEFFWNLQDTAAVARDLDLKIETRQFSLLSWGLVAQLS